MLSVEAFPQRVAFATIGAVLWMIGLLGSSRPVSADTSIPDRYAVALGELPPAVRDKATRACAGRDVDPSKWTTYRLPLKPSGAAYLIGCTLAASNDILTVIVEREPGIVLLPRFGANRHDVTNPGWDEGTQVLRDISGNGAACAHERRWKWNGRSFALVSRRTLGCR